MIYVEDGAAYAGMNEAWLGYDNAVTAVTASSEADGYPAENTQDGLTYDHWAPNASGDATLTLTVDGGYDYVAIAAHNCAEACGDVQVSVGGATVYTVPAVDDRSPIVAHLQNRTGAVMLTFKGATPALRVGVVYVGTLLQMQRTEFQGWSPLTHDLQENRVPSASDTGQYLGQILLSEYYVASPSWQHLTGDWFRANVPAFRRATRTAAFFMAWRPADYPAEVAYGWRTGPVKPQTTGPADLMSVSFEFQAVSHEP